MILPHNSLYKQLKPLLCRIYAYIIIWDILLVMYVNMKTILCIDIVHWMIILFFGEQFCFNLTTI